MSYFDVLLLYYIKRGKKKKKKKLYVLLFIPFVYFPLSVTHCVQTHVFRPYRALLGFVLFLFFVFVLLFIIITIIIFIIFIIFYVNHSLHHNIVVNDISVCILIELHVCKYTCLL